jgi:hypothetical protein
MVTGDIEIAVRSAAVNGFTGSQEVVDSDKGSVAAGVQPAIFWGDPGYYLEFAERDAFEGTVEGVGDAVEFDAHRIGQCPAGGVIGWNGGTAGIGEIVRMVLRFEQVQHMGPEGLVGLDDIGAGGVLFAATVKGAVALETAIPLPIRALMKRVAVG